MKLPFDLLLQNYKKPNIYLCETDKTKICRLETTDTQANLKFNAYSELECTIGRTYKDVISGEQKVNPFYHKIEALRLLYLEGFGYFEIQDPEIVSDGIQEAKTINAFSLEYSLSQKYLEDFYINTGEVDSVEVIYSIDHETSLAPVTFYNQACPGLSLLHLMLEKVYGWTIGHVDDSLKTMSRTFEISRASVYDFIMQDICEKFNCFTVFDTENNTINFYAEALMSKFIGDGKTTSFTIISPYKSIGSVTIDSYKTTAYTYNSTTGVLTFDTPPSDGAMIQVTDGSQEQWTTDVYVTFDNLAQEVNISYSADDIKTVLTVKGADDLDIREVNMGLPYITDLSYYYTVDWMGQDLYDAYTKYLKTYNSFQTQYTENSAEMLEISNYISYEEQRLSLQYSIASNVNSTTVGTYYIRGGTNPNYYYKEVQLPSEYSAEVEHYYTLSGNDLNETKVSKLYEALQEYYMSGTEKKVDSINALAADFAFMETHTISELCVSLQAVNTTKAKDSAVRTFLDSMWNQLGRTPLRSLYLSSYTTIQETYIESGWNKTDNENYWRYYPVTVMIDSINYAINIRTHKINGYQDNYDALSKANGEIASNLLLTNNFNEKQLIRLNAFLREDEYTDDNFVETDSDTIESLMKTKQELLECGRIELSKLCEPKLEFSMDMANIYALREFDPIIHQFQLGNLINVVIRNDYIKRARLLEVNINFDDFSDFSCEFGELTNLRTPSSIHADLLSSAMSAGKSVASNASYWDKGADLATDTDIKIQNGLLDATNGLYSSTQGVIIDKNGIRLTKVVNSETGEVSPLQAWIVNNNILFSSDGFKTSEVGLGEFKIDGETHYGLLAQAVFSGYIESSTIVGGTINIGNGTFMVDRSGNVTMNAASIKGYVEEDGVISSINQSPESITINANKISLAGKKIDLTSDNITISSTNFSVTKDGKITATSGEIAGWTIYPGLLRKDTTIDGVDYQIYMQSTDGASTSNAFVVRKRNSGETDWDYQFKVNYEGKLTAKNANITGTITATGGSIAGYNIGSGGSYDNAIYKRISGDVEDYEVGLKATSNDTDLAFYVKESVDGWKSSSNNFYIRNNGQLYAKNADITGKITASSGTIGGWNIGATKIYGTSNSGNVAVMQLPTDSTTFVFAAGGTSHDSYSSCPFRVTKYGELYASKGVIGGFDISSNYLRNDITVSGTRYQTFMQAADGSDTTTAFGVRTSTDNGSSWTYQFRVNYDGSAVMRNATITGSSTIASACIPNLSAAKITSGTLDAVRIPNLNADKITAGTLDVGRIPNISASKITSGTISTDRLDASVITTGNFSSKTLSTGNLTVASGCRLGVASEYNALIRTVGDYTYIRGYGPDVNYETSFYNLVKYVVQNSSNKDIKNEIHDFDNRYDIFFDKLNPQLFKYNFEPNSGYTMGYIWQDTEQARIEAGLDRNDIGAITETDSVVGGLALSKQDFIALNTWQIQKLKARVEELENKLAALEA